AEAKRAFCLDPGSAPGDAVHPAWLSYETPHHLADRDAVVVHRDRGCQLATALAHLEREAHRRAPTSGGRERLDSWRLDDGGPRRRSVGRVGAARAPTSLAGRKFERGGGVELTAAHRRCPARARAASSRPLDDVRNLVVLQLWPRGPDQGSPAGDLRGRERGAGEIRIASASVTGPG